jgi:hypothetical protein
MFIFWSFLYEKLHSFDSEFYYTCPAVCPEHLNALKVFDDVLIGGV